jgi:hypothetical protein
LHFSPSTSSRNDVFFIIIIIIISGTTALNRALASLTGSETLYYFLKLKLEVGSVRISETRGITNGFEEYQ